MTAIRDRLSAVGRPLVVAHRGASRRAPENSLEALRLAREEGADGVEFDVQQCSTGELVVFHDRTLARCTGQVGTHTQTPLDALRRLTLDRDAAHYGLPSTGARIPTLAEWLAEVPADFVINLEVKVESLAEAHVAGSCVDALEQAGVATRSVVSSFLPAALMAVTSRRIDRGALVESGPAWRWALGAGLLARPSSVHPEARLATLLRVRLWHAAGYRVCVWTVDAPDEVRRCLDAGVDVVITNRPDIVRPIAERFRR